MGHSRMGCGAQQLLHCGAVGQSCPGAEGRTCGGHTALTFVLRAGVGQGLQEGAVATMGPPGCLAHIAMCCALWRMILLLLRSEGSCHSRQM